MRIFSPKRYVASVDRIDLDTLWADGKRAILLDRDNTLVPRDTEQVPAAAVLIGDQLYTDVWSGNFAGVDTILVKPQATQDLWYTQIFRIFERRALRDLPCEE